jgi:hypothetical protein
MSAAPWVAVPPAFSDDAIRDVANGSSLSIAKWIHAVARQHGVSIRREPLIDFARSVSRLSDAEIDLDEVEELLIALRRAHVISDFQRGLLQVHYLR